MKILYIIDSLSSGGAEKLVTEIAIGMKKNFQANVEVLLLTNKSNIYDAILIKNGINLIYLKPNKVSSLKNIYYLYKHFKENSYDIVHANLFPAFYFTIFAKILSRVKFSFVMTEHSTYNRRREYIFLRTLERFIYNNYEKIISISQSTQNNLLNWLKKKIIIDNNTHLVINNGVNLEVFGKNYFIPKKFKLNLKTNYNLCMVGRFSKAKNQELIISIMNLLPNSIGLVLSGEGPIEKELKNQVRVLGLSDRVFFTGFVQDVSYIYQQVDLLVHSVHWEGFGLAVVEAMASGLPVIASDVPGLSSLVKDVGILFEPNNKDDLLNKIIDIYYNTNIYLSLKEKSNTFAKKYDISFTIESHHNLYTSIIDRSNKIKKSRIAKL